MRLCFGTSSASGSIRKTGPSPANVFTNPSAIRITTNRTTGPTFHCPAGRTLSSGAVPLDRGRRPRRPPSRAMTPQLFGLQITIEECHHPLFRALGILAFEAVIGPLDGFQFRLDARG